jgi:predicted DNA-binding transcriptional regulator AlpA
MNDADVQVLGLNPCPSPSDPDVLLTKTQAGPLCGVDGRTMDNWRWRGFGPPHVRVSPRCIRYRRSDILDWIEARVRRSTSS